ncbi:MAG: hypothetical protein JXA33_21055 [Anaerolineae bacterium]|nr:hypothetical protein [Anaerolineae bacterium]
MKIKSNTLVEYGLYILSFVFVVYGVGEYINFLKAYEFLFSDVAFEVLPMF